MTADCADQAVLLEPREKSPQPWFVPVTETGIDGLPQCHCANPTVPFAAAKCLDDPPAVDSVRLSGHQWFFGDAYRAYPDHGPDRCTQLLHRTLRTGRCTGRAHRCAEIHNCLHPFIPPAARHQSLGTLPDLFLRTEIGCRRHSPEESGEHTSDVDIHHREVPPVY
jgi:hypothetical protein